MKRSPSNSASCRYVMDCDFWEGLARRVNYQSRKAESQLLKGTYLGERESSLSRGEIPSVVPKIEPPGRSYEESNQLSERSIRLLDRIQHTSTGISQPKGREWQRTRTQAEPSSYSSYYEPAKKLSPRAPTFQLRTTEPLEQREPGFLARQKLFEDPRIQESRLWQNPLPTTKIPLSPRNTLEEREKSLSQQEYSYPSRAPQKEMTISANNTQQVPLVQNIVDSAEAREYNPRIRVNEKIPALSVQLLRDLVVRGVPRTQKDQQQVNRLRVHNIADIQIRPKPKPVAHLATLELQYLKKIFVAGKPRQIPNLSVELAAALTVNGSKLPKLSLCLSPIEAAQKYAPAGNTGEETSWRIVEKSQLLQGNGLSTDTLRPFHAQTSQDSNAWLHVPAAGHSRQRTADFGGGLNQKGADAVVQNADGIVQRLTSEQQNYKDDHTDIGDDESYPSRLSIKHFLEKLNYDVYIREKEIKQRLGEVCRQLDTKNQTYNPVVLGLKNKILPRVRNSKRVKSEIELRKEVQDAVLWANEMRAQVNTQDPTEMFDRPKLREIQDDRSQELNMQDTNQETNLNHYHQADHLQAEIEEPKHHKRDNLFPNSSAVTDRAENYDDQKSLPKQSQYGDDVGFEHGEEEECIHQSEDEDIEAQGMEEEHEADEDQADNDCDDVTGNEEQLPLVVEENTQEISQNENILLETEECEKFDENAKTDDVKQNTEKPMKPVPDAKTSSLKPQSPTLRAQPIIRNPGAKNATKPQKLAHLSRTSSMSTDQPTINVQKASNRASQSQPKQPLQKKGDAALKPSAEHSRASQNRPGRQKPDPQSAQQPKLGKSPSTASITQAKQTGRPTSAQPAGVGSSSSQSQSRPRNNSYQQRFEAAQRLKRPSAGGEQSGAENKKPRVPGRAEWTKWARPESSSQKEAVDVTETVEGMLEAIAPIGQLKAVTGAGSPVVAAELRRNHKLEPKAMLQNVILFPAAKTEESPVQDEETQKNN